MKVFEEGVLFFGGGGGAGIRFVECGCGGGVIMCHSVWGDSACLT